MIAATEPRVLVAGIGNVFFGDDGFGPAVVGRLAGERLPGEVDVVDYGIRGVHLAYTLLDGRHQSLILVDALPMGEPPGTLAVIEVDGSGEVQGAMDAHAMSPAAVLSALAALGGQLPRVLVVGCQPGALDCGMALSEAVAAVLDEAVRLVVEVAAAEAAGAGAAEVAGRAEAAGSGPETGRRAGDAEAVPADA
ncbi:MAG: hydrogenase maturation protease [Acidimicrobiales bacterium]